MKTKQLKEKLIGEFKFMRDYETWAAAFYRQVAKEPDVENKKLGEVFLETADDEIRHSQIIQKIINIIANNL